MDFSRFSYNFYANDNDYDNVDNEFIHLKKSLNLISELIFTFLNLNYYARLGRSEIAETDGISHRFSGLLVKVFN